MARTAARKRRPGSMLLALLLAIVAALTYFLSGGHAVFGELETRSYEWRLQLRGPREAPADLVILAIDDETLQAEGRWPLTRQRLAEAIELAQSGGAKSIGINVLLIDPEPGREDAAPGGSDTLLETALRDHPGTLLGMALLFEEAAAPLNLDEEALEAIAYSLVVTPSEGALTPPLAQGVLLPLPAFRAASRQGHVNVMLTDDGAAVKLNPVVAFETLLLPSFPVVLAAQQMDLPPDRLGVSLGGALVLGDRDIPLDIDLALPLNPYGPAGSITTYSLHHHLQGKLPADALVGKAVIIGATGVGLGERFQTAFDSDLPGVELLASGVANLLDGSTIERSAATRLFDALAILVLGFLAWALGRFLAIGYATAATLGLIFLWGGLSLLALSQWGLWIAAIAPAAIIVINAGIGVIARNALERARRAEAERQRGNLARYVSPLMAKQLAEQSKPTFDRRLQEASILFIDLGGFTGESEDRPLQETADFLVTYHQRLERVVLAHGGVIEQFQGDGAMVIFGLPEPRNDDAVSALACARDAIAVLHGWRPDLWARVGLHDGAVVIAQLGGDAQAQLAAAGDTVNVASRLEQVAKEEGVALVISEDCARKVSALGRSDLLAGLSLRPGRAIRGRRDPMDLRLATLADLGLDHGDAPGAQPVK